MEAQATRTTTPRTTKVASVAFLLGLLCVILGAFASSASAAWLVLLVGIVVGCALLGATMVALALARGRVLSSALLVVFSFLFVPTGWRAMGQLGDAAERAFVQRSEESARAWQPVVDAIAAHEREHGAPPARLDELTDVALPALDEPFSGGFDSVVYESCDAGWSLELRRDLLLFASRHALVYATTQIEPPRDWRLRTLVHSFGGWSLYRVWVD